MSTILVRHRVFVNTDPQRRCYNGCFKSYTYEWSDWEILESEVSDTEIRLKFWKDLNDYAVSQRGKSALREFKIEEEECLNI